MWCKQIAFGLCIDQGFYLIWRCSLTIGPEDAMDVTLVALERVQAFQDGRLRDEVFALQRQGRSNIGLPSVSFWRVEEVGSCLVST